MYLVEQGYCRPTNFVQFAVLWSPRYGKSVWNALLCGLLIHMLAGFRHLNEHFTHYKLNIAFEQLIEQGTCDFRWLSLLHSPQVTCMLMHAKRSKATAHAQLRRLIPHRSLPGMCCNEHSPWILPAIVFGV